MSRILEDLKLIKQQKAQGLLDERTYHELLMDLVVKSNFEVFEAIQKLYANTAIIKRTVTARQKRK